MQVIVDVFCSLAFAAVCTSTMPVTAANLRYRRVLPFYESLGIAFRAVLTGNGREFCGKSESHPYELLLQLEEIDHGTTKVRSPRTHGFVERMNRTLLEECFTFAGRTAWYSEPEQIQVDLDRFLVDYNREHSHQGYRPFGRTPVQALCETLGLDTLPPSPGLNDVSEAPDQPAASDLTPGA